MRNGEKTAMRSSSIRVSQCKPLRKDFDMKRTTLFALAILLSSLTLSTLLTAQEVASLTGVVTDKTGAVIPSVSVKLIDTRTNATYSTTTNAVGSYTFSKALPGPGYKLVFTKDGFQTYE